MKIVNRQPIKTADISSNRGQMWRELRRLTLYAGLLVAGIYFSIGLIVDLIVPSISPSREAAIFSRWSLNHQLSPEDEQRLEPAQKILDQLVLDPTVPPLPYRLILINDSKPNAFAFPGGTIGLTRGLLDVLEGPESLAFVLGHELGHFQQRDHLRGLGRSIGINIIFPILFGGEMGSRQFSNTFTHILSRSYSREQEEGADRFGLGLVFRLNGKTEGCDQLFQILIKDSEIPEWAYMLSTHPAPEQRIKLLEIESKHLKALP